MYDNFKSTYSIYFSPILCSQLFLVPSVHSDANQLLAVGTFTSFQVLHPAGSISFSAFLLVVALGLPRLFSLQEYQRQEGPPQDANPSGNHSKIFTKPLLTIFMI